MITTVREEIQSLRYKLNALRAMGETDSDDYKKTARKVDRLTKQLDAIVNPEKYKR